jgi:hypothetical protein
MESHEILREAFQQTSPKEIAAEMGLSLSLVYITTAAADRTISVGESEKIRQQWDELKAFTEGFVRCCEEGNFEKRPALTGRRA